MTTTDTASHSAYFAGTDGTRCQSCPYREELADRVLYSGVRTEWRGQGGIRRTVAEKTGVKDEYKGADGTQVSGVQTSEIDNPVKRAFYEMETIIGCWSVKELERQIHSLYYEHSGLSQNKEALSALVQQQAAQLQPKDVINTPVTLEFLGLNDRALVTESDLEQSILDNLQNFLLEMGHGFCFEARQKRILKCRTVT